MNNKNGPASAQGRTPVKKRINKKHAYFICTLLAAVFILAMAVVLMSVSDNRAYNDYMNQAQQLYYNKDYDGALSVLRKAASIEKTDECQLLMASCYENQGNYTRALEVLRGPHRGHREHAPQHQRRRKGDGRGPGVSRRNHKARAGQPESRRRGL